MEGARKFWKFKEAEARHRGHAPYKVNEAFTLIESGDSLNEEDDPSKENPMHTIYIIQARAPCLQVIIQTGSMSLVVPNMSIINNGLHKQFLSIIIDTKDAPLLVASDDCMKCASLPIIIKGGDMMLEPEKDVPLLVASDDGKGSTCFSIIIKGNEIIVMQKIMDVKLITTVANIIEIGNMSANANVA